MTVFERIKKLAQKRGKSMQQVAEENGFSSNLFYRWKKSDPKAKDIAKIADYFHVTTDYLLGRENIANASQEVNPDDQKVLAMFRKQTEGMTNQEKKDFQDSLEDVMTFAQKLVKERKDKN